jgi:predicted ATPase
MDFVFVWVLTGGPCSGKTTVTRRAKRDARLKGTIFLSEVAAEVIKRYNLSVCEFEAMRDPVFVREFQRLVAAECVVRLLVALRHAHRTGAVRIILDRYTLDGSAYVPGGVVELVKIVGMEIDQMIKHVHGVLYLCPPPQQHYKQTSYRKEGFEESLPLGVGVRKAWVEHHPKGVYDIDGATMKEKYEAFVTCILDNEQAA